MTNNTLTKAGLQIQSLADIQEKLTQGYKTIYGDDIHLDSNSPDGQLIGIFTEVIHDMLVTLQDVYLSFNPDQATGSVLDARVALNGITRKSGTYTSLYIDITANKNVTLLGLYDNNTQNPESLCYTVKDESGNLYIALETTSIIPPNGHFVTKSIKFRAKETGVIVPVANTINKALDILIGVTEISNPPPGKNTPMEVGRLGELDVELRQRRRWSLSLSSMGIISGMVGGLMNIPGVIKAQIFENNTNTTDSDHIPPNSIWPIIEYTDAVQKDPSKTIKQVIAETIYHYKSAGCGLYGQQSIIILTPSDQSFEVKYDQANPIDLYLKFDILPRMGSRQLNQNELDAIKEKILQAFIYTIAEVADASDMIAFLVPLVPDFYVDHLMFSKDQTTWSAIIEPTNKVDRFILTEETIIIHAPSLPSQDGIYSSYHNILMKGDG